MSETAVNGVEPIIFLDDVHVTFRTRTGSILHPNLVHAVQGVTIKLMPGQTIGIVGESGCGKSTTANVMCGLQAPTSGKVYFKGKDVTKRTAEDRRHMGRVISVVFQNPATALNPRMVVREQLLDPMRVHNLGTEAEQEKRVKELLELTGLPSSAAEVLPGQLSGGQRQRVAIARALSLNPDAIIADEPTSALDVSVRAQILNLLTDLKKELGLAMVFISHDIQTVRYISDDIIVMNGGKIVEQGGGLGIATCALNSELINRAAILYPFLSDFRLVWDLDADDIAYEGLRYWSRWFDEDSTRIEEAYAKLAYFDSKNFAPMVKCPVLFGTGTADIVCPPATQFAVYNNLSCDKRHEFFEGFGHEEIQDFDDLIIPFFCEGGEAHV